MLVLVYCLFLFVSRWFSHVCFCISVLHFLCVLFVLRLRLLFFLSNFGFVCVFHVYAFSFVSVAFVLWPMSVRLFAYTFCCVSSKLGALGLKS